MKACYVRRKPTDWSTPAVIHASYALRLAGKNRIRFPNFIRSELIWRIASAEPKDSEFPHLAYLAFLFAFRVPSEALVLQRAHKGGEVDLFTPQKEKALIACRAVDGVEVLIAKLAWRKNMPGGCIPKRPCFCPHDTPRARGLCPIRWLWPCVRAHRQPGEFLFQKVNANNVNRFTRKALSDLNPPAVQRYSSHGFRRGAPQELKESGAQWPIVAEVGKWKELSFRPYVDLSDELAESMAQLFIESYSFDSDEEC